MIPRLENVDYLTKLQYVMMVVFGALTAVLALAPPLGTRIRILGAGVAFGITIGLWLSHLLSMVYETTADLQRGTAQ
ncbi:hypothetical protein RYH80_17510 [Halobaculum sp. MBLA0147]|uniref:hypothetical protein n=1 Tax=Halobaculum sp. MBLA0147 TaxID=3079934 RepID=UPI0035262395